MQSDILDRLAAVIAARQGEPPDTSYTAKLLSGGVGRCARKVGEEAAETVIAAVSEDEKALASEAADLVFHLLVLLQSRGVAWADVTALLEGRMGTSGLAEKASRGAKKD